MKQIITILSLLTISIGTSCSSSEYGSIARRPTFTIAAPPVICTQGMTFVTSLDVQQTGIFSFSLSAVVLSGSAEIEIDGDKVPPQGLWFPLPTAKSKVAITPTSPGELKIRFQVQSASGDLSAEQLLSIDVQEASDLQANVVCPEKFVNPRTNNLVPMHLTLNKTGLDDFSASIAISKGQGNLFYDGKIVNNAYFTLPSGATVLLYRPDVLGEHIIDFTIKAGGVTTMTRAYVEVVKNIVVTHSAPGTITVTGIGEYSKEGEKVVLAIDHKGYNFEPEGWYSADRQFLSGEATCPIELHADSPDTISLKLKKRIVNIKEGYSVNGRGSYLIGAPPQTRYVYYAYKTVTIDSKASERINFYYESYYYNTAIPPKGVYSPRRPFILNGYQTSKEFTRIDGKFKIYLRRADNPEFKFFDGLSGRYIESTTTRYYVPSSITMQ